MQASPSGSLFSASFTNKLYLLVPVLTFIYILIRAILVPATYDEVYTIDYFVSAPAMEIINYTNPVANNHMLNTLLIKGLFGIAPETLFTARIPNVLGGMLYLFFAVKICRGYFSPFIGLCCLLLLVLNPFLLDFFSLARGYGLGLGFQMAALYFLVRFVRDHHQRSGLPALIYGAFGVLSCFSLLNFWLITFGVVCVLPLMYRNHYPLRKPYVYYIITALILGAILFGPLTKLRAANALYYGGNTGLYQDTLTSLAKFTFYEGDVTSAVRLCLNIFLLLFVFIVIAATWYNRKVFTVRNVLLAVLLLCLLAISAQHFLFDTAYIIDRTALYLIPLTILVLGFSLEDLPRNAYAGSLAAAFVLAFAVNFSLRANFYKSALWFFDAHSEELLSRFNEEGKRENRTIHISFTYVFRSTFDYYMSRGNFTNLKIDPDVVNGETVPNDYHIHLAKPLDIVYQPGVDTVMSLPKKEIDRYEREHVVIYKLNP